MNIKYRAVMISGYGMINVADGIEVEIATDLFWCAEYAADLEPDFVYIKYNYRGHMKLGYDVIFERCDNNHTFECFLLGLNEHHLISHICFSV